MSPDIIVSRLGLHTGVQANARLNFMPRAANPEIVGVTIDAHPVADVAHGPWPSVRKTTTLGRRRFTTAGAASAVRKARRVVGMTNVFYAPLESGVNCPAPDGANAALPLVQNGEYESHRRRLRYPDRHRGIGVD